MTVKSKSALSLTISARDMSVPQNLRARMLPHTVKQPSPLRETWNSDDLPEDFLPLKRKLKTFGSEDDPLNAFTSHDAFGDISDHVRAAFDKSTPSEESKRPTHGSATSSCSSVIAAPIMQREEEDASDDASFSDSDTEDESEGFRIYRVMRQSRQDVGTCGAGTQRLGDTDKE